MGRSRLTLQRRHRAAARSFEISWYAVCESTKPWPRKSCRSRRASRGARRLRAHYLSELKPDTLERRLKGDYTLPKDRAYQPQPE